MSTRQPPPRDKFIAVMADLDKGTSQRAAGGKQGVAESTVRSWVKRRAEFEQALGIQTTSDALLDRLRTFLKVRARTIEEVTRALDVPADHVQPLIEQLMARGVNVQKLNHAMGDGADKFSVLDSPAPTEPGEHIYTSRRGGYYKFGYISDNHYCSKYAREDVTEDLYDWFADHEVDRVFNTGNYIDGEARFNKHDIFIHGMQNQLNYFCEKYPKRKSLTTYFVSGDDHEGWYGQREGVDIGWLTQKTAEDRYRRKDLVHLGFVESFVKLQHADIKDSWTYLLAVHPGGGSSYATSYAPQKFVEALQGGEKPAVALFGHWHKIFDLLIRNVICLGGGCTKDLDPFGRKNKLAYHIGGMIVELWQDELGAITRYRVEKKQYFDRDYKNHRWSYEGRGLISKEA